MAVLGSKGTATWTTTPPLAITTGGVSIFRSGSALFVFAKAGRHRWRAEDGMMTPYLNQQIASSRPAGAFNSPSSIYPIDPPADSAGL